jgi:hypothetical protein
MMASPSAVSGFSASHCCPVSSTSATAQSMGRKPTLCCRASESAR